MRGVEEEREKETRLWKKRRGQKIWKMKLQEWPLFAVTFCARGTI